VIVLSEGKNHAQGTFDVLKSSTDPIVKQFFEGVI
jgi:ABC-type transporter Mla maintaining outer membrane lipid asymmetry ATPase subunit MlaF